MSTIVDARALDLLDRFASAPSARTWGAFADYSRTAVHPDPAPETDGEIEAQLALEAADVARLLVQLGMTEGAAAHCAGLYRADMLGDGEARP